MAIRRIVYVTLAAFVLGACSGGGGGGNGGEAPDPSNPDSVMRSLTAKVGGSSGTLREGDLPTPSEDPDAPTVATTRSSQTVSNGSTAQVPLEFEANSPISRLLAKVQGSGSVLDIDVSDSETQSRSAEQMKARSSNLRRKLDPASGANLELTLPPRIKEGEFTLLVTAVDAEGRASQTTSSIFRVARVGSGALQFSLTWDTTADLDLRVFEPDGFEISFENTSSPSGGMLDFDDTDGTGENDIGPDGQNAIENIFWEESAPRGRYIVDVDYFSGNEATNFTVTVSVDGEILDSVSRANFTPDEGRVQVLELDF